ncbi:MAG TPA: glycogen debranching N-terminal domain-containing protein [Thermoanaerobaculia bacterium]|nr:glycogen debranching N-terminal domain-containing protein [Thermoanaerobaculia bacterium]
MTETSIRMDLPAAWFGSSLLITSNEGECGPAQPLTGFYVRETRHLATLRLEIDGATPWCCERSRPDPAELAFVFNHPELTRFGGGGSGVSGDEVTTDEHGIPYRALDLRLIYRVEPHRLCATLRLYNRSRARVAPEVAFVVAADYADLLEASENRRQQEAPVTATTAGGVLRFHYEHPRLPFTTTLQGSGSGQITLEPHRWASRVELAPQAGATFELRIDAFDPDQDLDETARAARVHHHRRWLEGLTRITVPGNPLAERILGRASDDLASFPSLEGDRDEWLSLQAGIPLYPAFFGRDALTAGWQGALLDRGEMLDAALTRLGKLQSERDFAWRDEEPGRIPFQVRTGPLARLEMNPFSAYYADFASPLMFVISLANLYAWTGERGDVERHWGTACRILEWARTYGDRDGDGYLEYLTRSPAGTKNQGWKDSGDAIVYDDGRAVPAPIATCELQGYWYAAQQLMAVLAWVLGERGRARGLWREARALKRRFNRDFWVPEERFYGLALDPGKQLVRAATSNVGHCLATGIIARERLRDVADRLLAPDLFSGWGIRTLTTRHAAYNPLSYHLGSVWPVENATICFGLRRMGFGAEALRLAEALFRLSELYAGDRMPECVGGYASDEHPTPGAYPRSNSPQTWNASALPLVLQTLLGLLPYAARHVLLVDPLLPSWLPAVELHGLRVGKTTASLRFRRGGKGRVHVRVLAKDGPLHIIRQPPPEAVGVGLGRRLRALLTAR